jgi:hypothetical protein
LFFRRFLGKPTKIILTDENVLFSYSAYNIFIFLIRQIVKRKSQQQQKF